MNTEHPAHLADELAPRIARLIIMLRRETAAAGLSRAQLSVLAALRDGGPRRITDLAELEQVTQPSMTLLVSRMQRQGWVARRPDLVDRRGVLVVLTEDGRRQLDRVVAARSAALGDRLARLRPEHRDALAAAVPALDAVMDDDPARARRMTTTAPPTASAGGAGRSLLHQPKAVWAVAFACVIAFMGIGLVDPILPAIATDLHASPSQVELLFTSYFAITGVSMLVTGVVSSRLGAKRTLLAGLALIVTFSALAGASGSVGMIVGFRAGWGLGNALFIATALAVIVGAASGGVAGAIILYEAALGLGIATGPLLGGLLGGISWRGPFFGTAVLMSIGFVAVFALLPRSPRPDHHTSLADPIRALRHRGLLTVGLTALFYNFGFFTLLGYAPFPLHLGVHGLGFVFFGWGLVLAVTSVFAAPWLQRRFGTIRTLYVVLGFFAVDLLAMGIFTSSQLALILAVIFAGGFLGVNNTLVTETVMKVSPVERPVASAGYSFIRFSGGAIAPYLAGKLAEWFTPHVPFYVGAAAVVVAMGVLASGRSLFRSLDSGGHTELVVGDAPTGRAIVLLAVDHGPDAAAATDETAQIAAQHGASVEVLHVRETDVVNDDAVDLESADEADRLLADRLRQLADQGITADGRVVQTTGGPADVADVIVRRAAAIGAEMVVLIGPRADAPRLGRGAIRRVREACGCAVLVFDPERASDPGVASWR